VGLIPLVKKTRLYSPILQRIFSTKYRSGATEVEFARDDISRAAGELGIRLPKNLGDLIDSFRYRAALPDSVRQKAASNSLAISKEIFFMLAPSCSSFYQENSRTGHQTSRGKGERAFLPRLGFDKFEGSIRNYGLIADTKIPGPGAKTERQGGRQY
jgi:hypothetical protein